MRTSAALAALFLLIEPGTAMADGRYCVRVDDRCWSCADIPFGFSIPCASDPCGPEQHCVDRAGVSECYSTTELCCTEPACDRPPGCDGAATSCSGPGPGVITECVFLSDCPDPLSERDAGVPEDAGVLTRDAGSPPRDAGSPSPDAGAPRDDAGPPRDDAGPPLDAATHFDAGEPPPYIFRGGGGCVCRAAATPATPARSLVTITLLFFALTSRRRVGRWPDGARAHRVFRRIRSRRAPGRLILGSSRAGGPGNVALP